LTPLQSVTNAPPWATGSPARADESTAHPFRGSFPFSVFPTARSHIIPMSFHLTGHVAPLGFRTPSTPCSPHDLSGLFHPDPAHGVLPSRLYSPRNAVRSLERHNPHAIGHDANAASPPQGFARPEDPALRPWGLAKDPSRMPPWDSSPPRFLALRAGYAPIIAHPHPHTLRRLGRKLALSVVPQGTNTKDAVVLSRDRRNPHEVLHLVDPLSSSKTLWRWVIVSPRQPSCVTADRHYLFAPPIEPPAGAH
jgi:hypothetical protein